jgi:transposase
MAEGITFVGLDVHQETIDVAIAEGGGPRELRHLGTIGSDLDSVDRLVRRLERRYGSDLRLVYEAGPTGFALCRHLRSRGRDCQIVSPSMIPRRAGDRIKTDRRDSLTLARLHRSGDLVGIRIPGPEDEAVRDLVRAREDAVHDQRRAKQRLKSFLLRHGRRYRGRADWSIAYRRWLADQYFPYPAQQIAYQEYVQAEEAAERRVQRLTAEIHSLLPQWVLFPVVEALQACRGVSLITAATVVAEVGEFSRFTHPTLLMAYLGLVPSQDSSGPRDRHGPITKAGNAHVRRALVEAAWAYRGRPAIGRQMLKRQEHLPAEIRDIAWKAQLRLCGRFRKLSARRKEAPKIATAIARELSAFLWDIARRAERNLHLHHRPS